MYSSGTSPCCDFHDVPGMRLYNTTTVFIMTHPTIRPRVARMLKAGGINAAFLDLSDLMSINMEAARPLRSPMSFSLLAIVEEAVAADARAFLGTAESSMTGMIVQTPYHSYTAFLHWLDINPPNDLTLPVHSPAPAPIHAMSPGADCPRAQPQALLLLLSTP
ncbi:hypothetical protein VOLCADRAFT_101155 [Volvox carteri f. nagariensis]|uniref:Uncharacterized protein n=1 Tax=Volvox carteri f. nagariensis TaxID=3068 RepID=D8ULW6_VOLCA|nr:uncharacterized protein VOLCADRAFT_101155 [Volvox carteri f. nagariensis]EFJ39283.1 hypothetical protein VOLCADRAFT_101155 [Volvox carteri f. nagariensis]|eukprot:XP_002959652.1 hypothetical protein VOLCADRAFT_101155 [Volvox carteri f. nagariensis]